MPAFGFSLQPLPRPASKLDRVPSPGKSPSGKHPFKAAKLSLTLSLRPFRRLIALFAGGMRRLPTVREGQLKRFPYA
jgi:hypothetical protein